MSADRITWIKASASGSSGNCVEFGVAAGNDSQVFLRDSKNKQGPVLAFKRSEIAALLDGARRGEFDRLSR